MKLKITIDLVELPADADETNVTRHKKTLFFLLRLKFQNPKVHFPRTFFVIKRTG
jgi:hypothetical protein